MHNYLNNFDLLSRNKTASQSDIPPIRNKISNCFLIPTNLQPIHQNHPEIESGESVKINLK